MGNKSVSDFVAASMDAVLKSEAHRALFGEQYKFAQSSDKKCSKCGKDMDSCMCDSAMADDNDAKKSKKCPECDKPMSKCDCDSSKADDNDGKKMPPWLKDKKDSASADDQDARKKKDSSGDSSSADDDDNDADPAGSFKETSDWATRQNLPGDPLAGLSKDVPAGKPGAPAAKPSTPWKPFSDLGKPVQGPGAKGHDPSQDKALLGGSNPQAKPATTLIPGKSPGQQQVNIAPGTPNAADDGAADDSAEELKSSAQFNVAIDSLLTASAALDAVGMEKSATLSLRLAAFVVEAKKKEKDSKKKKDSKKDSKDSKSSSKKDSQSAKDKKSDSKKSDKKDSKSSSSKSTSSSKSKK